MKVNETKCEVPQPEKRDFLGFSRSNVDNSTPDLVATIVFFKDVVQLTHDFAEIAATEELTP